MNDRFFALNRFVSSFTKLCDLEIVVFENARMKFRLVYIAVVY